MVGHAHLVNKQYRNARKTFSHILMNKDLGPKDPYALVSNGNLCLRQAADDPAQKETHIKRAVENFCYALHYQPNNIRAATGIAIAYARSGLNEEAKEIFNVLQGCAPLDLDIVLNAAHVLVSTNEVQLAISLYESVLKKQGGKNSDILSALARTHYITAKTNLDPISMLKAKDYISKAIELEPQNDTFKFNQALIWQQYAYVLVYIDSNNRINNHPKKGI